MKSAIALLAILFTGEAAAKVSLLPPAKYDRPHPDMQIEYGPRASVDHTCRLYGIAPTPGKKFWGCSVTHETTGRCFLFITKLGPGMSKDFQRKLIRHERAHCHGWLH